MIASYPVGGVAWDYGQYALGLERLGFEVTYLEDTGWQTYDPTARTYGDDSSFGVAFLGGLAALSSTLGPALVLPRHGRPGPWARRWRHRRDRRQRRPAAERIRQDILRRAYMDCRSKVLIDTDPGWNHFRNYPAQDALTAMKRGEVRRRRACWSTRASAARRRSAGLAGGERPLARRRRLPQPRLLLHLRRTARPPGCKLPDFGLPWRPTRPPVVLDLWSRAAAGRGLDHSDELEQLPRAGALAGRRLRVEGDGVSRRSRPCRAGPDPAGDRRRRGRRAAGALAANWAGRWSRRRRVSDTPQRYRGLHPGLAGRGQRRQEPLRGDRLRLVQLPVGLLPRRRVAPWWCRTRASRG